MIGSRRNVAMNSRTMIILRDCVMYIRSRIMTAVNNYGRGRNKMKRVRINSRAVNGIRVMKKRSGLINPSLVFLRSIVNTGYYLGCTRCKYASDTCLISDVLDIICGLDNFAFCRRLLEVNFILNRIFRVGLTRIALASIRNCVDNFCAFSFRTLRGFAARIRTYY